MCVVKVSSHQFLLSRVDHCNMPCQVLFLNSGDWVALGAAVRFLAGMSQHSARA